MLVKVLWGPQYVKFLFLSRQASSTTDLGPTLGILCDVTKQIITYAYGVTNTLYLLNFAFLNGDACDHVFGV